MHALKFVHRYMAHGAADEKRTILLLHGTGGTENDLLEIGLTLLPGASFLSPRGNVNENGMNRFFKRFAEGQFDEEDIRIQASDLADFLVDASKEYGFDPKRVYAAGYSNGANIASALLFLHPDSLAGAILWRGMVPLTPDPMPDLSGKSVLMLTGLSDPIVSHEEADRLEHLYSSAGASVRHEKLPTGHGLVRPDFELAQQWMRSQPFGTV